MSSNPAGSLPPPASRTPESKLIRNIEALCIRIERGKAANQNPSVMWQRILGIVSILFSSLGSVGVIADKASENLPGETGWEFWGSVILLLFGILSQIANQFQVAKRAADSESLARSCQLYETRLENMLMDDDPSVAVANLLAEVNNLFESEQYNQVLPKRTAETNNSATQTAHNLVEANRSYWQLTMKRQKGISKPPAAPPE